MRTKTLFLTAAISAASLATSLAQSSNVFSANIVGYVNAVLTPGFHIIANPLNTTNNTVVQLFASPPLFTTIFKFTNPGGFGAGANTYFGGSTWSDATMTLPPGQGFFINIPAGANYTNTFVGEVVTGNSTNALRPGFNLVGSIVPQSGLLVTTLSNSPALFDTVFQFTDSTHSYPGANTYFGGGTWGAGEPNIGVQANIGVAEGFWYNNAQATTNNWTRTFTVN